MHVKSLFTSPRLVKAGDKYLLEIDSPLVSDAVRHRLRQLDHVTDASFQASLVKLPADALVAMVAHYLPEAERAQTIQRLRDASAPGTDLPSWLKAMLVRVGSKLAEEVGERVVDHAGEQANTWIRPLFNNELSPEKRDEVF